jgi:hypothetical protein
MKLTGENRSTRVKICPSATLSTTNPIWTDPGSNPGLRGERPATNSLSHGTASSEFSILWSVSGVLLTCQFSILWSVSGVLLTCQVNLEEMANAVLSGHLF